MRQSGASANHAAAMHLATGCSEKHTAGGMITWEGCACEVCQCEAVPLGTWYDEALRLTGWYEADLCPDCGRSGVVAGDWLCPRCTDWAESFNELWEEHERPQREAQQFIARWLKAL